MNVNCAGVCHLSFNMCDNMLVLWCSMYVFICVSRNSYGFIVNFVGFYCVSVNHTA